jgi:putative membrane protein
MTAAMVAMHRKLPRHKRYPLPPRRITMRVADKLGVKHHLEEGQRTGLTMLAHFGYGAAVGTLFGVISPRESSRAIPAGIGYGLLVWAGSYLGLLPSMGLHRPATREPAERNGLMIAAHVVWGAAIGALAPLLRRAMR